MSNTRQYGQENLFGKKVIKSISFDEQEIIRDILYLHANGKDIDCDPTYSIGNFYKKGLKQPKYKFDLNPQVDGVLQADARCLPLENESQEVIMFDPPFICGIPGNAPIGIIKNRFGYYKNVLELWSFYSDAIKESYRILKKEGILIFKCQDTIDAGKQYFSHVQVMNYAVNVGYYPKDLFELYTKTRIIDRDITLQKHARKFHSYFWVFQKSKSKVNYQL